MQGHEADRSGFVVQIVRGGNERNFGEEIQQGSLGVRHLECARLPDQFLHVFRASVVLRVARILEDDEIPRGLEQCEQHVDNLGVGCHCADLVESRDKRAQGPRDLCPQAKIVDLTHRLAERNAVVVGEPLNRRFGDVADAAFRSVEHTAVREVVIFVRNRDEVRHDVLDFGAFVEFCSADQAVRHTFAHQDFFECARLGVGSIEHRHLAVRHSAVVQRGDLVGDKLRFVVLGYAGVTRNRFTRAEFTEQLFRHRGVEVVADDGVCRIENGLRRTVVLFENDDLGAGKIVAEFEDVADVGTTERVNGLVGVPHDRQGRRVDSAARIEQRRRRFGGNVFGADRAGQLVNQFVLRLVRVLIFIDEDVSESTLIQSTDLGESPKKIHGLCDEVIKVERIGPTKFVGVPAENIEDHDLVGVVRIDAAGERIGVDEFVFQLRDLRRDPARSESQRIGFVFLEDPFEQRLLVGRVIDGEGGRKSETRSLVAQNPHTRRVEGGNPHPPRFVADEGCDALAHFGRSLVRKGDREDLAGPCLTVFEQQSDASREDGGLSRARSGHDQQRRSAVHNSRPLLCVEPFEERFGVGDGGERVGHVLPSLGVGTDVDDVDG